MTLQTTALNLARTVASRAAPPPDLTASEWADLNRRLSSEASAEPGRWRTDRTPYMREILDAINDPRVETIVIMSSAQVGKTELLLNAIGYFVDYDPAPMLLLQPTLEMAQTFSKDRLAPMCRDTPALRNKIQDAKAKSSGNTMLHKTFAGGHITMAGANSPASLASRPVRIVLADEVDRYPVSAGTEGDPVNLAVKRTTTFWNKKIILVSTPTIKGVSRIEKAYENSTQERFCYACPSCHDYQPMRWRNINFDTENHACESCGTLHTQNEWMASPYKWVASSNHHKIRGFHLNELISPWRRWPQIIEDFREAKKSPDTLKTFVNTSLGETWEEEGSSLEHNALYIRREHYPAEVPTNAVVLTASVDVQDDRLEIQVEGWGVGEENYKIDFRILRGDPSKQELWDRLDEVLSARYKHQSAVILGIACTAIDSGGHYAQQVYKFVKRREIRRIYAIKGKSQAGAPVVGRPSKSNLGKINLFGVGSDTAKELIYKRLQINEPGAGYIHFPVNEKFDEEWFEQLTAEKCVTRYKEGRAYRKWIKSRPRNEALDLSVYNLAALYILNPNFSKLAERLNHIEPEPEIESNAEQKLIKKQPEKTKRNRRGGFATSW
jgi:phage terminase large subunit GpA-like protein